MPPTADLAEAVAAAERALGQFAGLLRSGIDPAAPVTSDWTVRDVAAHVAGGMPVYVDMVRGSGSPIDDVVTGITDYNAETVRTDTGTDLSAFADRIDAAAGQLAEAARSSAGGTVKWHAGIEIPVATAVGLMIPEGYVHGYDVAHATGRAWPIPEADARLPALTALPLLAYFVDEQAARDVRATYDVRLRGPQPVSVLLDFDRGRLEVADPDGRRVDCHMSVDPVAFLLTSYGRMSPLRASLTGKALAWGRKPWLALKLTSLLRNP